MIIMLLFVALIPAPDVHGQDYDQLFQQGVQQYRAGEYTGAAEQFEAAAAAAGRKRKYADALYNAGTSRARIGEQKADGDILSAAEEYRKAILDYERVLEVDGKFEEAAHNLEVARNRLNELEKTMEQEKSDQDRKDQDRGEGSKDREQDSQGNGNGDQSSSGNPQESREDREQSGSGQDDGADHDRTGQGQEEQDRQDNRNPGTLQEQQGETAAEGILKEEREERLRRVFESYSAAEQVEKDW